MLRDKLNLDVPSVGALLHRRHHRMSNVFATKHPKVSYLVRNSEKTQLMILTIPTNNLEKALIIRP